MKKENKLMGEAKNEIVVYQTNETMRLDVRLENETVWLNRHQMAQLFGRDVKTIGKHIANALKEELSDLAPPTPPHDEGSSVVVAKSATTRKGNVFPTVPPMQGVFYNGQVFDAKVFAAKHILSAKKSILLIDSWVDVVTLELLAKKAPGVTVEIVASHKGNKLSTSDIATFNKQYGGLTVCESKNFHDRFLIIDDKTLYLIGASLKDLGWKCFAFTRLDSAEISNLKARI